ncbi:MAG: DUF2304 family protein, partial [Nitrospirae bacterium]
MKVLTIFSLAVSGVVFLAVLELVRRNRLKERYSLLWLFSSVVMIWFSFSARSLRWLSE